METSILEILEKIVVGGGIAGIVVYFSYQFGKVLIERHKETIDQICVTHKEETERVCASFEKFIERRDKDIEMLATEIRFGKSGIIPPNSSNVRQ